MSLLEPANDKPDCLREVLVAVADATPAELEDVKRLLAPKSGKIIEAEGHMYVFIEGAGFVLSHPSKWFVTHDGIRFTSIGINLSSAAKIEAVSPEAMTIRDKGRNLKIAFTSHAAHLRIERLEIQPHKPSLDFNPVQFAVPTILTFDSAMNITMADLLGAARQVYLRYYFGLVVEEKTVTGTRVQVQNAAGAIIKKYRQLHREVTYSKNVFTLTLPDCRVQATLVGVPLDPDATPGCLIIKDNVFTFTWGSSIRMFKAVPNDDGYVLEPRQCGCAALSSGSVGASAPTEPTFGLVSMRDRNPTSCQMHPDVTRFSDGTYILKTKDGDVKYTPMNYAYLNGKIIPGMLHCQTGDSYTFEWLGNRKTYAAEKNAAGETVLVAAD